MISEASTGNHFEFRFVPGARWEKRRRQIVTLVCVVYWLLIFEGALRKWIAPQFSRELFFIRDPFVLWIYWLVFTSRLRPQRSIFLLIGIIFSLVSIPLIALQFANSYYLHSWLLPAYGWRNYFLYLPLAFIVGKYFKVHEFERLMRWTLLVAIPIAVLVYAQAHSPASAVINQGTGSGEDTFGNGGVALGVVRTYGTFTSSPGQGIFIGSVIAMLLASWLRPARKRPLQWPLLVAASVAGVSCLALSGSRGAMVASGIIFAGAIAAAFLTGGRSNALAKCLVPILIVAAGVLLAPIVFPKAVDAMRVRWEVAGYSENLAYGGGGILGRAVYEFGSFRYLLASTPLQGYQLGIGGNAADVINKERAADDRYFDSRLIAFGPKERAAAESDWGRQILELGPALGLLFIAFRVAFVLWLGKAALDATIRSRDPLPLILFAFIGVYLFNGQITGHGTLNGYGWLFAGFCMAMNRASQRAPGMNRPRLASLSASGDINPLVGVGSRLHNLPV